MTAPEETGRFEITLPIGAAEVTSLKYLDFLEPRSSPATTAWLQREYPEEPLHRRSGMLPLNYRALVAQRRQRNPIRQIGGRLECNRCPGR